VIDPERGAGILSRAMDHESRPPSPALIFDPFAGISGDMVVGALLDLGLSEAWLRETVAAIGLGASLVVERVDRSGIACTRIRFEAPDQKAHRHLPDILEIVDEARVPAPVKEGAAAVFEKLAEAEAAVHGIPVSRVHFHEVGALDSILDVLCSIGGVHELGFDRFFTRPVAVGSGTVAMAHGSFPLPAPATARLLEGLTVRETGHPEECTTPTGAALLSVLTRGAPPPGEVVYGRTGFGAGTRNPPGRPNCLRLIACSIPVRPDRLYLVQADIDDLSPEYVAGARDTLTDAGAVDVATTRIDMKKGRPGLRLEVLTPESALTAVTEAIFLGTRTIGLRYWEVARTVLEREAHVVEWRGHQIRHKRVLLPDGSVRSKPEYDDVIAAARATGLSPHQVRAELGGG
jgi:pyridinium-3,5-bisthiocarboxylic acid mononucleotide nickel chelatase